MVCANHSNQNSQSGRKRFGLVDSLSTSNAFEDELPTKRRDLHQSWSNLSCTISFFVLILLYHFSCKIKIGNRIVKDPNEVAEDCMIL